MNNYKLKINKLLIVSAFITIIIMVVGLYYLGLIEKAEVKKAFGINGTITVVVGFIWWWFKEYGWKTKFTQKFKTALNIPPNLNGRWEGVFKRPEHTESYPFVIEIEQTIDTIVINTYSRQGHSKSSVYNILTNDLQSTFYLHYFWQAKAGKDKQIFSGYTMLKLIENDKEKKLTGSYFTDRKPKQTEGVTTVIWKSNKLKKEFYNASK